MANLAEFSALPLSGPVPLSVQFTDESTGTITDREWTFDDGDTSTDTDPLHEYTDPGVYSPELKVIEKGLGFIEDTATSQVGAWRAMAYGNGVFVVTRPVNGTSAVKTSPDGITWEPCHLYYQPHFGLLFILMAPSLSLWVLQEHLTIEQSLLMVLHG